MGIERVCLAKGVSGVFGLMGFSGREPVAGEPGARPDRAALTFAGAEAVEGDGEIVTRASDMLVSFGNEVSLGHMMYDRHTPMIHARH